jgi:hypothetical protein
MALRSEILTHNAGVFHDDGVDVVQEVDQLRSTGGPPPSKDWLQSVSFGDQQLYQREEQRRQRGLVVNRPPKKAKPVLNQKRQ